MTLNIGAFVQQAMTTASRLGVAQTITVTRAGSSFTATAVREDPTPAAPPTGGTSVSSAPTFTVSASETTFAPAFGDLLTDANGATYRVLAVTPVVAGSVAVAYTIEVAS